MLSIGTHVEVGGTGAQRVDAENFSRISPAAWFGKGFGDLPENLMWLKPIAITGTVGFSLPDPWKRMEETVGVEALAHRVGEAAELDAVYRHDSHAPKLQAFSEVEDRFDPRAAR